MDKKLYQIGYRTFKTAIGSGLALFIAQYIGLENYATAAIITLLSIQSTKKKSLLIAGYRFLACIIGMALGAFLFEYFGYKPLTVVVYFLVTIPLLARFKLQEGIVVSSVIVLQLYVIGQITMDGLLNQLALIIIGIIIALIMNMYMPSAERNLKEYQRKIEHNLKYIFMMLAVYLKNKEDVPMHIVEETIDYVNKGRIHAFKEVENSLLKGKGYYFSYFEMRERQLQIITQRIVPMLSSVEYSYEQTTMIAHFLEEISVAIHEENTAEDLIQQLHDLKSQFKEMELPKTREEFETRAALVNVVKELENFLYVKRDFLAEEQLRK
ncbi:MAG: aromatic acid exporter family protein [Bacillaceae bacterium]